MTKSLRVWPGKQAKTYVSPVMEGNTQASIAANAAQTQRLAWRICTSERLPGDSEWWLQQRDKTAIGERAT